MTVHLLCGKKIQYSTSSVLYFPSSYVLKKLQKELLSGIAAWHRNCRHIELRNKINCFLPPTLSTPSIRGGDHVALIDQVGQARVNK